MTSVETVDQSMTDRMWSRITRSLVDTGRPPHYAELARALGAGVPSQKGDALPIRAR